jgi:hypothetical protein
VEFQEILVSILLQFVVALTIRTVPTPFNLQA